MSIDKSKIKAGDQVKLKLTSGSGIWLSDGFVEVTEGISGLIANDRYFVNNDPLEVLEHKPNLVGLERDVETARNALVAAEAALAIAKKDTFDFDIGTRVRYIHSFSNVDNEGKIVDISATQFRVEFERWGTYWYKHEDIERL